MKREAIILGIDPGFANMGLALVRLDPIGETVLGLAVMKTEKDDAKRSTRAADDNVRRAREIGAELLKIADTYEVVMIAAECMSFPRSASVAAKMAMAWGVLAMLAEYRGIAIAQASPQRIKRVLCGSAKASKDEVESALLVRYGNHIEDLYHGNEGRREHVFDALGAVVATLDSEVVRVARAMAKVA
jgi:crossover junction endodeoxyribonuclease RuvC